MVLKTQIFFTVTKFSASLNYPTYCMKATVLLWYKPILIQAHVVSPCHPSYFSAAVEDKEKKSHFWLYVPVRDPSLCLEDRPPAGHMFDCFSLAWNYSNWAPFLRNCTHNRHYRPLTAHIQPLKRNSFQISNLIASHGFLVASLSVALERFNQSDHPGRIRRERSRSKQNV